MKHVVFPFYICCRAICSICVIIILAVSACQTIAQSSGGSAGLTDDQMALVRQYEQFRVGAINRVAPSVIAIYDDDRQGGGSGVIISPSGIALTNHHVIIGAGVKGWGGLAGDKMYRWELIGTDPGGDVSVIQMLPDPSDPSDDDDQPATAFPWSPLGDSDKVNVGDWVLAMGNPFLLTEDQSPTVTLGIVSGIKRYQYGAGKNQLVYGNCIQVDSSINPGNSGGPLFNFDGEVIGINGRGSFQDRGRVNVGLGYAISSNQIKNFIPDLLATKLVEHGTLDCNFSDRDNKVVCSTLNRDSPVAAAGLELGDELLEFEGIPISTANQFTNLICTLPATWPARLKLQSTNGDVKDIHVRLLGLPYPKPKMPRNVRGGPKDDQGPSKEAKQRQRQIEMARLLSAKPGIVRNKKINRTYVERLRQQLRAPARAIANGQLPEERCVELVDEMLGDEYTTIRTTICGDGRFVVEVFAGNDLDSDDPTQAFLFDGRQFKRWSAESLKPMTTAEAKRELFHLQAIALLAMNQGNAFTGFEGTSALTSVFGKTLLSGSDQSSNKNAWRFRTAGNDDDPLYWWAHMDADRSDSVAGLAKVSATLDCVTSDGAPAGVILNDWQPIEGFYIARERTFVSGLAEAVVAKLRIKTSTAIEPTVFRTRLAQFTQRSVAADTAAADSDPNPDTPPDADTESEPGNE